ncbi:Proto-oncogene tyrosine-protein kinase ROS-like protein, partial [Leptotrombidium deliense]
HPYTARSNLEVWDYVRSGGRLDLPNNCPEELSLLLNQCWSYKPECRPSFSFCLRFLEQLQKKLSSINMVITMVQNQNYVISHGFDNPSYKEDEYYDYDDRN